ncbi:DUF6602 domain-containing protein [Streptomyces sp. NPDC102274]|uniref:DUF6602 domain-containing protein n=1 Tax=Streptomyces sp. NPDC102274 TaxID=3366151 RepID=UPI00381C0B0F
MHQIDSACTVGGNTGRPIDSHKIKGRNALNEEIALAALLKYHDDIVGLGYEFDRSETLGHSDALGFEREDAIRRILAYQFPEYAVLHRSVVRSRLGKPSYGQHDIVISDCLVPPHIVSTSGRHMVVDPQAVHSALEIKSTLDSIELPKALKHLSAIKGAPRVSVEPSVHMKVQLHGKTFPYVPISAGIVAYRSKLSLSTIASRIEKWAVNQSPELWPNFVTVLDRGHLMWCSPHTGDLHSWGMEGDRMLWFSCADPTDPIAAFSNSMESLAQCWNVPGTKPVVRPPKITGGVKIGSATRPPGVPEPDECDCLCANCHLHGRVSFTEQRRLERESRNQQR